MSEKIATCLWVIHGRQETREGFRISVRLENNPGGPRISGTSAASSSAPGGAGASTVLLPPSKAWEPLQMGKSPSEPSALQTVSIIGA